MHRSNGDRVAHGGVNNAQVTMVLQRAHQLGARPGQWLEAHDRGFGPALRSHQGELASARADIEDGSKAMRERCVLVFDGGCHAVAERPPIRANAQQAAELVRLPGESLKPRHLASTLVFGANRVARAGAARMAA